MGPGITLVPSTTIVISRRTQNIWEARRAAIGSDHFMWTRTVDKPSAVVSSGSSSTLEADTAEYSDDRKQIDRSRKPPGYDIYRIIRC